MVQGEAEIHELRLLRPDPVQVGLVRRAVVHRDDHGRQAERQEHRRQIVHLPDDHDVRAARDIQSL
ncbi:hypothetical protein D3C86_2043970 [compost metagenome]